MAVGDALLWLWIFLPVIIIVGLVVLIITSRRTNAPESAQPKLEHSKTLEEYKKDYLAKKKMYGYGTNEELFLQAQKKVNDFMNKKGYSLSEAVGVVAEDYHKRGIYLTVDPSGTELKISGNLPENSTVQKPAERKESESNFCDNCGNQLKPDAKFCGICGTKV